MRLHVLTIGGVPWAEMHGHGSRHFRLLSPYTITTISTIYNRHAAYFSHSLCQYSSLPLRHLEHEKQPLLVVGKNKS